MKRKLNKKYLLSFFIKHKIIAVSWYQFICNKWRYRYLSEDELTQSKKSDTVFIFGSGYSINDISYDEWRNFEKHDTISFNWFLYQNFVRIDYHIVKEIAPNDIEFEIWYPKLKEYAERLSSNPFYKNAIILVQKGRKAISSNRLFGLNLVSTDSNYFRYKICSRNKITYPSFSLSNGLVHNGTLAMCINFAITMGWKKIILVGIDLYDRRYFWLKKDESRDTDILRGVKVDTTHNMGKTTIGIVSKWNNKLLKRNIELFIYNPKSLLSEVLPVFSFTNENESKR